MGSKNHNTWDLSSGLCPNGHKLEVCRVEYTHKNGRTYNVCKIRRQETTKAAWQRRVVRNQEIKRSAARAAEEAGLPLKQRLGTLLGAGNQSKKRVVLVCGHVSMFRSTCLPEIAHKTPDDMYCRNCGEWKRVHEVSSGSPGTRGMIYFPSEVKHLNVAKHVRNAGYGRA